MAIGKSIGPRPTPVPRLPRLRFADYNDPRRVCQSLERPLVNKLELVDADLGFGFGFLRQQSGRLIETRRHLALMVAGIHMERHYPTPGIIHLGDAFLFFL